MGFLLETGKYRWKYVNGEYIKEDMSVGLQITESFRKGLTFYKSRMEFKCCCCEKQKPKRTRYLGSNWERVCLDCAMKWIEVSENTMKEIIKILKERKAELSDEKKGRRWRKYSGSLRKIT